VSALVELQSIAFHYVPERPVFRELDLSLMPDDRVALVGPNGSGKSTLLQMIVGLIKPVSGTVWAFGLPRAVEGDFREVRRQAGLLFQDSDDQLFCPTVGEDVAFGPLNMGLSPEAARVRAEAALVQVGLAGFEDRITYRLSGGEKRLAALAGLLAMAPRILLLDEPLAGLDADAATRVTEIIKALPQELIVVSHEESFLSEVTHRRLYLHAGKLHDGL
jgi:cobalt/nickel transport system ATP-binding protein